MQMKNLTQIVRGYSFVSKEHLKKESVIHGKMPVKRDEVVVDKIVIDKLKDSSGVTAGLYDSVDTYLGTELKVSGASSGLTVTGICDTGEPAIYCGQNVLFGFDLKGYLIANVEELQAEDTEKYKDVKIADDEILVREGLLESYGLSIGDMEKIGDVYSHEYEIAGTIPDEIGVDYVLSDKGCQDIRDFMIYERAYCMVYCKDTVAAKKYFADAGKSYINAFKLGVKIPYEEELKLYKEAHSMNVDAKKLITVIIVLISMLMVYFMIKSNAMSRSEELTVYRLLGISRGSILKAYILEMVLMTCYTSLPAVLVTSGVIKFISAIPSLEIGLLFPWWSVLVLLVVIYAVHALISVLPIYGILSKPPATLAVKE